MTDKLIEQITRDREAGTPGPWAVDFSYQWPSKVRAAPPFNERWICDASAQPSFDDQSHTLANARRIARVPDYEARILADTEVIKAAEVLADAVSCITSRGVSPRTGGRLVLEVDILDAEQALKDLNRALQGPTDQGGQR